jgi:hypothetical protein
MIGVAGYIGRFDVQVGSGQLSELRLGGGESPEH